MDAPRPELDPLRDLFPLKAGRVQIDLVDAAPDLRHLATVDPDQIWAPIRVLTFEPNGWIRDILEQPLMLAPHPNLLKDPERLRNCIDAHVEVLTELFARAEIADEGTPFPAELLYLGDVLTLRKASSREEFAVALRARKRLGKRLG